ncbi:hypothetical protein W97_00485 [Coniosporium apollinis CBS 100218]|uniref:Proteasome maturation factor UMP1 n=1 Tax=Coniosporium apollinis (strain CBS 100218) TaxID=1168221 RepID=R7YH89_CONA1|nr:uncharacterized protein W97_00485 [Coniosporium apollinis CBS 100218]EON61272.1 hypothetical protein W97_00485 [Coniosporium apollinis CBS 100218]
MALRIAPPSSNPTTTPSYHGAPSAPGIHDTLRSNLSLTTPITNTSSSTSTPQPLQSSHPLEARLANWRATQDALKMEGLRRTFGMGEPIRRGMERRIVERGGWRPALLGMGAGVHEDILGGRDCEIAWEDVYKGDELRELPDFHTEMEARLRMNW